jgi:hypothetical protein
MLQLALAAFWGETVCPLMTQSGHAYRLINALKDENDQ